METPEEILANWKKQVKKTKNKEMLGIIKLDLESEKDMLEVIVWGYEELIEDIENKLEEGETKNEK